MPIVLGQYFDAELARMLPLVRLLIIRSGGQAARARREERTLVLVPRLRYLGGALSVELAGGQRGAALGPGARRGFASAPEDGVRGELVVLNSLATIAEVLHGIVASVERWRKPNAAMFDPSRARAEDVVGIGAMALRAAGESPAALAIAGAGAGINALAPPAEQPQPERPLRETLERIGRPLLALALGLPVLTVSLAQAGAALMRTARLALLTALAGVEGRIDAFAEAVRTAIPRALTGEHDAWQWLDAFSRVFALNWPVVASFLERWAGYVERYLKVLAVSLYEWGDYLTRLLRTLLMVVNRLGDMDLLMPALRALGVPTGDVRSAVTLNRVATEGLAVSADVRTLLSGARAAMRTFGADDTARKTEAIGDLLAALEDAPPAAPPEAQIPGAAPPFPDVLALVFGDGRRAAFEGMVAEAMGGAGKALSGQLGAAAALADRTGAVFAAERGRVSLGDRAAYLDIARRAHAQATAATAIPAPLERREDAVASAFEAALAGGGIAVAGAALGVYTGELRRYWEPRVAHETSPHKLAARGRLQHVRTPRLKVKVPGRAPDDALVAEVTERIKAAVGELYAKAAGK